jgi:hypothetical protein
VNNEDKSKDSGGVEVVADQAEDGSYEFRVERARRRAKESGGEDPTDRESRKAESISPVEEDQPASASSVWRADGAGGEERTEPSGGRRVRTYVFSAAVVALLLIAGGTLVSSLGSDKTPKTVEIEEPAFQGVFVETPPLVVDEMAIVEDSDASDTTGDTMEEQPEVEEEEQTAEQGQLAPPTEQRDPDEPVIDDIVKSALDNVAEEDERGTDEPDEEGEQGYDDEPLPPEDDEVDPYYEDEYYEGDGDEPYPDEEYEDEYYDEEPLYEDELPPEEGTEDY